MPRRSTAQVRQLLLDASARTFRAKGYGRATNDEIAETAGVSMSVMFRHFPTKGDLFREALMQPFLESMKVFSEAWKRTFSDPADEEYVMRAVISGLYDSLRDHEEAVTGLLVAEESLDAATGAEIAKLFNDLFAQLGDMGVKEADRRDWFSGDSMELNARLLVGMVTATVAYRRWFLPTGRNRISRERLITHMTNLMLYGLRLAPSEAPAQESATGDGPPGT